MQYLEYEAADFLSVQLIPLTVCEKVYAPLLISTFFFFAFLLHPFADLAFFLPPHHPFYCFTDLLPEASLPTS